MIRNQGNITSLAQQARPEVVDAIRQASSKTGVDFSYLLQKAATESSFNSTAQAPTSSARGLYQFVDRTWLDTIDKHGAEHGLVNAAAAIKRDNHGNPVVTDAATRQKILALRDNPRVSAMMAAELAQDNQASLENSLGRKVGNTELYLAHFLGAGGAAKFLSSMEQNPETNAAQLIPEAARANKGVFFKGGKSLTVDQVFARFASKFDAGTSPPTAAITAPQLAQAATIAAPVAAVEPGFAALMPGLTTRSTLAPTGNHTLDPLPLAVSRNPALANHIPLQALPSLAMRIIESLSLPGEQDQPPHSQEWLV